MLKVVGLSRPEKLLPMGMVGSKADLDSKLPFDLMLVAAKALSHCG
jgi:hypothetical protein